VQSSSLGAFCGLQQFAFAIHDAFRSDRLLLQDVAHWHSSCPPQYCLLLVPSSSL
jgi:hypothetical protein